MARYMAVKPLSGAHHGSAQSSPDSVLAFSAGPYTATSAMFQHAVPIPGAQAADDEILDLWDNIWFGVSESPTQLPLARPVKIMADPLANTIPLLGSATAAQQQPPNVLAAYRQLSAAQKPGQQQQQLLHSQQQAGSLFPGALLSAGKQAAAAAQQPANLRQQLVSSGGPHNMVLASSIANGKAVHKSSSSSSIDMLPNEHRQQMEQQDSSQQQAPGGPAPYVLGTWAHRQYRMPMHRSKGSPRQQAQEDAADAAAAAALGTSVAQPIPSTGRWPSTTSAASKSGGCNGSKGSGGAGVPAAGQAADPAAPAPHTAGQANPGKVHGSNAAALAAAAAAAAAVDAAVDAAAVTGRRSIGTDDEEEAVTQAAWRWRFAKRWQAEQARGPVDPAASVGDGGMEEALQYLAACGENWHLARGTSGQIGGSTAESRLLGTLGTPSLLGAELLVDESYSAHGSGRGLLQSTGSGGLGCGFLSREASHCAGMARGEATRQVTSINKRAAQLLAAQSDINKAVTQRWREVQSVQASELWVGALLESVEVDDWGEYKFLLLRLRDRSGRQKLLVRGANYASDAKIVEGLHRQMMAACAAHDVCGEAIEVVGGGVMEWRRHRDRHLHISGGYVAPTSGPGGPSTGIEVMNLAAVLTKQHLPMHYKVTSEGGKAL